MTLESVAIALFGQQWQTPLSRALDVNIRTVQRWAAGENPPPVSIWADLADLCAARRDELGRLAGECRKMAGK